MLKRRIAEFWNDKRGYVIALTLIAMPLLLGFSLLVIDASRGENLHTDLQDAVDALALGGARQLDGRDDAISRAEGAMGNLLNSATFGTNGASNSLGGSVTVSYAAGGPNSGCDYSAAGSTVHVLFLKNIPASDDSADWRKDISTFCDDYGATNSNDAAYARVIAKPQAMKTIFPVPVSFNRDTVAIGAEATAVYEASACDVTPIFICNPFEPTGNTSQSVAEQADADLHTNFANGDLYGVQIELHNNSGSSPGPGNFGFLNTFGNGANVLSNALATGAPGVCYKQATLESKTGATTGPVAAGLNTRFGIYEGSFGTNAGDPAYRPAQNIRMAQSATKSGKPNCSSYNPVTATDPTTGATVIGDPAQAVPLGFGAKMGSIGTGSGTISEDSLGNYSNNWNYTEYWRVARNEDLTSGPVPSTQTILDNASSYPASGTPSQPSAYDVYRYEIANPDNLSPTPVQTASLDGETGTPPTGGQCYTGPSLGGYSNVGKYGDRRLIFTAIVNCGYQNSLGNLTGGSGTFPAVAFASVFLTKPAIKNISSGDRYISMEVVDITGKGGRGTLDDFLREESELVR